MPEEFDAEKVLQEIQEKKNQQNNELPEITKPDFTPKIDETKDLGEQAKDFVSYSATAKAVADEKFVDEITKKKQKEIKQKFSNDLKKEENKSLLDEKENQKNKFGVNEGVAAYAGIKKDLPNKMQTILFAVLQIFQGILLFLIGIPTSIVNITMDCINSIIEKFATLAVSAKKIILVMFIAGLIGLAYIIIKFICGRFGLVW